MILLFLFFVLIGLLNGENLSEEKPISEIEFFNYDSDIKRDTVELIQSRGFYSEVHKVTTADGYILTMFRIVNPNLDSSRRQQMTPVLLQHGLFFDSTFYLIASLNGMLLQNNMFVEGENGNIITNCDPSEGQTTGISIAFVLATCGYDVWLGNGRGNGISNEHLYLSELDPRFWEFTFVEVGRYDLSAMINHILNVSNKKKLNYIGHSQGATDMFVLLSEQPDFADKIDRFIALSGVVFYLQTLKILRALAPLSYVFNQISFPVAPPFSKGRSFLVSQLPDSITPLISIGAYIFQLQHLNQSFVKDFLAHFPVTTSSFTVAHYGQCVASKRFAYFDYGCKRNQIIYNQNNCSPPDIPLEKIRLEKIAIFYSPNDFACRPIAVQVLKKKLTVNLWKEILVPNNFHDDYVLYVPNAINVNSQILRLFKE